MRLLHAVAGLGLFPLALARCGGSEFTTLQPGSGGSIAGSGGSSAGSGGSIGGSGGSTGDGGSGGAGGSAGQGTGGSQGTGGIPRDASVDVVPPPQDGGPPPVLNSGDCKTEADCQGNPCVELSKDGYRVCELKVPPPRACNGYDACCANVPCTLPTEFCVPGPIAPHCGGMVMIGNVCATNLCLFGECAATQVCVPAGALGYHASACIPAGCHLDTDCPGGGICAPVTPACCSGPTGLYCVYENGGGCRSNADCCRGDSGCGSCILDPGGTKAYCTTNHVTCPM